jgi:hypothetical protein
VYAIRFFLRTSNGFQEWHHTSLSTGNEKGNVPKPTPKNEVKKKAALIDKFIESHQRSPQLNME